MTQEEFQKIVLKELCGLKDDVGGLKEDVSGLKEDVNTLKEDASALRGQVTENTSLLKAVLHNQAFMQVKVEGLEKNAASAQFAQALDERQRIHSESINLLASRQLRVEAEIEQLKKAQ